MDHVWAFESDPAVGGSGTGTVAAASTENFGWPTWKNDGWIQMLNNSLGLGN
jgi:hypothetical protein